MTLSTLSVILWNKIICISQVKIFLLKLILKINIRFITTHFPSGNAKMKKVLLFHACKINILATMDILRITVITQNEKVGLITSLVHLWRTCRAKMSSYPSSTELTGAPKRQNEPKFNTHILTLRPYVRIDFLNPYHIAKYCFRPCRELKEVDNPDSTSMKPVINLGK